MQPNRLGLTQLIATKIGFLRNHSMNNIVSSLMGENQKTIGKNMIIGE